MAPLARPTNVCAPPKPVCRTVNYPIFEKPLSHRRVPECSPPTCPQECYGGNPALHINALGTIDREKWIEGWITTQLFTRGHIDCEEHILGKTDGGWWADSFRTDTFSSGSKLWALKWHVANNEALITAKDYALAALNYLIDWGIVATLAVRTFYVSRNVMNLIVKITGPGISREMVFQGTAMPDATWLWAEYRQGAATTTTPLSQRALVA